MLIPDVPSVTVPGVGELLACEFLHAAGFGSPPRPGGRPREPEAALNGDAGRGAGMSSTSMSEYCSVARDWGAVAVSYVGGFSVGVINWP